MRESLRRLEGYQIQDVRDQEMLAPISERVVAPLLEGLTGVAPALHAGGLRREGRAASWCTPATRRTSNVDKILVMKLLGIVSVVVWIPLVV